MNSKQKIGTEMANNKFNIGDMVFITSTKAVGKVIGIYFDEHRFKLWQDGM